MKRSLISIVRRTHSRTALRTTNVTAAAIPTRSFSNYNKRYNIITNNNSSNIASNAGVMNVPVVQSRQYSSIKIPVPDMGDSISDGTLLQWEKKAGEYIEADETICQIETDKVVVEVKAPQAGVIKAVFASEGETVAVGHELVELDTAATKPASSSAQPTPAAEEKAETTQSTPTPTPTPAPAQQPKEVPRAPAGDVPVGGEKRVPMTRMRARIAQRLKDSQNTYAMLTTFNEVDMSKLMEMRSANRDEFEEKHGQKLGFMGAFVKASSLALKNMPVINAVIDGDDIVYRDYIDISVAVATPTGLVVPVVRNTENKSIAEIEKDIAELGRKGREGKITLQDMQGGTFTISNGGVFGSLMGTPIINPPQSAILGMHATKKRPVVVTNPKTGEEEIAIRPMMYLALTYDHRLVDGREAVLFLRQIKDLIENPEKMLLQ